MDPDQPEIERPRTEWSNALHALMLDVVGSTDSGPPLGLVLDTVRWMRLHPNEARILIGDLTKGY